MRASSSSADGRAARGDAASQAVQVPPDRDWLPLQQAACELGVSLSTARRMIRRGELRNRMVARRGGFAYLVYLPGSRHAQYASHVHPAAAEGSAPAVGRPSWRAHREAIWNALTQSIGRALRPPAWSGHLRLVQADGPYARYRWLARKRRWWRF